jgi:putative DNA primase/helicase
VGPTDSGKSTLLSLIEALLGIHNVSHATLQEIADNQFAGADLYGKLANIASDLDARVPKSAAKFKQLVGGTDTIRVERKYRDAFDFRPFAKLMFSANEPPGTSDQSDAFYGRWFILPMGRQRKGAAKDVGLLKRMSTPTERSGLLSLAVQELRRLDREKQFSVPRAMMQAAGDYRARTDTVVGFVEERCALDNSKDRTRSSAVYADYTDWCEQSNRHPLGAGRFREHLSDVYPSVVFHKKLGGYPTWAGIRLEEPGEEMGSLGDPPTPIRKAVSL